MAQGGCPDTPAGFTGSPYNLAPEFNDSLRHVYGAVGAGRDDNPQKLSAGCQFYIVANKNGLARLDGNYTVYGQVIKGMDVVEAIVSVPTDSSDAPLTPIPLHVDVIDTDRRATRVVWIPREVAAALDHPRQQNGPGDCPGRSCFVRCAPADERRYCFTHVGRRSRVTWATISSTMLA